MCRPSTAKTQMTTEKEDGNLRDMAAIRRRFQLAEAGRWQEVLQEHLAEWPPERYGEFDAQDAAGEEGARQRSLQLAVQKAESGSLRSACQHLVGQGRAPPTPDNTSKSCRH